MGVNTSLAIADLLGHADPKTATIYTKVNIEKMRKIVSSNPLVPNKKKEHSIASDNVYYVNKFEIIGRTLKFNH
jgi:hypothetical protein